MPRVVHFEISADDPERASQFYRNVFGWGIEKWQGPKDYWMVRTGDDGQPGINGGLFKREGPVNYVNTIDVSSVDEYVERVKTSGGQLAMPKMPIPGVGYLAYCHDTEGNLFGVIEADANAT